MATVSSVVLYVERKERKMEDILNSAVNDFMTRDLGDHRELRS